jgi:hypothetical protein
MDFKITKILELDNETILYYVQYGNFIIDYSIAEIIGLCIDEYHDILEKFGAFEDTCQFYFSSSEDCKKAIEYLEAYLVAKKLRGLIS